MTTLRLIFIFNSCRQEVNSSVDIKIDSNSDTMEIIKRYPSKTLREIVIYKNNKATSNIGLNEQGDTLKHPQPIYIKSTDSLFVYIPTKYQYAILMFDSDSTNIIMGKPKYRTEPLRHSILVGVNSKMYTDNNQMKGAIKCWDSTDKFFRYFAFLIRTK